MRSLIIFDLDGTLAHTAPDLLATLNRVTEPDGIRPVDLKDIGQVIGHGAKAMIKMACDRSSFELTEARHNELFAAFLSDYSQNLANETHLFEGVLDAMDALASEGFVFSVCTNKMHQMAVPLLEQLGVTHRFKSVTGGNSFVFRKPEAKHLEETAKLAGKTLNDAIMIGDSSTDINAALNAGIPSVAVTFGYTDQPVETLGASKVISHFNQLQEAIHDLKHI